MSHSGRNIGSFTKKNCLYFWCYYSQHQKSKQILKGQILQGAWIWGNLAQARFSRWLYTLKFWLNVSGNGFKWIFYIFYLIMTLICLNVQLRYFRIHSPRVYFLTFLDFWFLFFLHLWLFHIVFLLSYGKIDKI